MPQGPERGCWKHYAGLSKPVRGRLVSLGPGGQLLLAFRYKNHSVQPQFQLTAVSSAEKDSPLGS